MFLPFNQNWRRSLVKVLKLVICFCFLANSVAIAQDRFSNLTFTQYTRSDGLSHNTVHHIMQDTYGFIWVSTRKGLNRFEGSEFVTFNTESDSTRALSANLVWASLEDDEKNIWIGTKNGGLNRYNPRRNKTFHYLADEKNPESISSNTVTALAKDGNGTVWAGTEGGGLNRIIRHKSRDKNEAAYTFKHFIPGKQEGADVVLDIAPDSNNNLWIATYGAGVYLFESETGTFSNLAEFIPDLSILQNAFVMSVELDKDAILWIGTKYRGAFSVNLKTGNWQQFTQNGNSDARLSSNFVWDIYIDDRGLKWISSYGGGINIIEENFKTRPYTVHHIEQEMEDSDALPDNYIMQVMQDTTGMFWTATDNNGFATFYTDHGLVDLPLRDEALTILSHHNINKLIELDNSTLLAATNKGLLNIDLAGGNVSSMPLNDRSSKIYDLKRDLHNSEIVWLATNYGLIGYNIKTYNYNTILPDINEENAGADRLFSINIDSTGIVWATTDGGLLSYNSTTGSHRLIQFEDSTGRYNSNVFNKLENLALSPDGLWISIDDKGLLYVDRDSLHYNFIDLNTTVDTRKNLNEISDLAVRDGKLWVTTLNDGLLVLNHNEGTVASVELHLNESQGMPESYLRDIAWLHNGVWLVGPTTFSRYEFQSGEITAYSYPRNWSQRDTFKGIYESISSETLVYGSFGIRKFQPTIYDREHSSSPIRITGLYTMNKPYATESVPYLTNIMKVKPDQNFISINYAALNYDPLSKSVCYYKLEGHDAYWVPSEGSGTIHYSNLDPGSYTFRIKHAATETANHKAAELEIIVKPYFWQTWWFMFAVSIFFVTMGYGIYRFRINAIFETYRTRERIAGDLHDDLGATLSSISLFSQAAEKKLKSGEKDFKYLKLITESADQAKENLSDIIWSINPEKDDWELYAAKCRRYASDLLESNGIDYKLSITPNIDLPNTIKLRKNLWLIFKELVINAAKHSNAGLVDITCHQHAKALVLIVEDDGEGIKPEDHDKGNGLKNIRRRAEEINAQLQLDTEPGKGTRWQLKIYR